MEGATKWEGGASEVLLLQRGDVEIVLTMLKGGGGGKGFGVVLSQEREVLAIPKCVCVGGGGGKIFPPFKRGDAKSLRGGGGANSFGPAIFPFCSPPPPRY